MYSSSNISTFSNFILYGLLFIASKAISISFPGTEISTLDNDSKNKPEQAFINF